MFSTADWFRAHLAVCVILLFLHFFSAHFVKLLQDCSTMFTDTLSLLWYLILGTWYLIKYCSVLDTQSLLWNLKIFGICKFWRKLYGRVKLTVPNVNFEPNLNNKFDILLFFPNFLSLGFIFSDYLFFFFKSKQTSAVVMSFQERDSPQNAYYNNIKHGMWNHGS